MDTVEQVLLDKQTGVLTPEGNLILMNRLGATMVKPMPKEYLKNFEDAFGRMKYFEPKSNFARNSVPLPHKTDAALIKKYNEERRFIQSLRPVLLYMKTSGDEQIQAVVDMCAKQFNVENVSKEIVQFNMRELDKLAQITSKYI